MTAVVTAVVIALVVGVCIGAAVMWLAMWSQRQRPPEDLRAEGQLRLRIEDTLRHVQEISAVLANPVHRGRAGEFVLENVLEAAGMAKHRDFSVQVAAEDGLRPDIVVNLASRGRLVIDSKFPLDEFQRALAAQTEAERRAALTAYAKAVQHHFVTLARRDYPSRIDGALDFTVCFVPADDLLAAAAEAMPGLFENAVRLRVLPATPASLVALLWGVASGWRQDARVQQAEQVGELGAQLHQRIGYLVDHLQTLGRTLNKTVDAYNKMLGSLETRVLPQARRFEDLGILAPAAHLPEIPTVDGHARLVSVERFPPPDSGGTTAEDAP